MSFAEKTDWIQFFHEFGVEIRRQSLSGGGRLSVFLSVPFLDYAGVLTASGILAAKYRSMVLPAADPYDWMTHYGRPVSFPFELRDGGTELKRKVGTIEGVEDSRRGPCLSVRYLDNLDTKSNGKQFTRFVMPRWLPTVQKLEEMPDLETWKPGSRLASNIRSIDSILGQAGAAALIGKSSKDCLIIDVKNRTAEELKDCIELQRLGVEGEGGALHLADIIRPDGWGPEAMRETFSSRISQEPEPGWEHAIISGSLNFLNYWEECDAAVKIAILCPFENAYEEAVGFANQIYYQRISDVSVSEELLALKPSIVDFQIITCGQ